MGLLRMKFIVFEGLDGAGKSTLISKVQEFLVQKAKIQSQLVRDPGSTSVGEKVRSIVLDAMEKPVPRAEVLLYEAARAQLVDEVIRPRLAQKIWILSDRFYSSTVAFQAVARSLGRTDIDWLNRYACAGLVPDLVIFIDIPVAESQRRLQQRQSHDGSSMDRMEQEKWDFHEKVRQGYLLQAKESPGNWLVLDGMKTPEHLLQETTQYFERCKWLDN